MHFSAKTVLFGALVAQSFAHPLHADAKIRRYSLQRRTVDVNRFRLQTNTTYVNSTEVDSGSGITKRQTADYIQAATDAVKEAAPDATFRLVEDHYIGTNGVAHVNFKQTVNDLDIDNADFNVNVSSARREMCMANCTGGDCRGGCEIYCS